MSKKTVALLVVMFVLLLGLNVGVIYAISAGKLQLGAAGITAATTRAIDSTYHFPENSTDPAILYFSAFKIASDKGMSTESSAISQNATRYIQFTAKNNTTNVDLPGLRFWVGYADFQHTGGVQGRGGGPDKLTIDGKTYNKLAFDHDMPFKPGATWTSAIWSFGPVTQIGENPNIIAIAYQGNSVPTTITEAGTTALYGKVYLLSIETDYLKFVTGTPKLYKEDKPYGTGVLNSTDYPNDPLLKKVAVGNVLTYEFGLKNTSSAPKSVKVEIANHGFYGRIVDFQWKSDSLQSVLLKAFQSDAVQFQTPYSGVFSSTDKIPVNTPLNFGITKDPNVPITLQAQLPATTGTVHFVFKVQVSGLTNLAWEGLSGSYAALIKAQVFEGTNNQAVLKGYAAMPIAEWGGR